IVCAAVCRRLPVAWSSPVFKLRSKRGKLLEEISRRTRCPGKNTWLVAHKSIKSPLWPPEEGPDGSYKDPSRRCCRNLVTLGNAGSAKRSLRQRAGPGVQRCVRWVVRRNPEKAEISVCRTS